jgi:hypothetical protein
MEWVMPIDQLEAEFRRYGAFLLVDFQGRKLWYYGVNRDGATRNRLIQLLKGRNQEMVLFLTKRASAKGEIT